MMIRTLLLIVLLGAAGAIAWLTLREAAPAMPAPVPDNAPSPASDDAAPGPESAAVATPPSRPSQPAPRHAIRLPDGSSVPALNGVENPPALLWPPEIPWSPIVSRETGPDGQDWYVHADGSRSTSRMAWREELGRLDATTMVQNPAPVMPAGDAGPRLR